MARYYQVPNQFPSFTYLSQVVQAEGVRFAIETHRRNMPRCMGSLYWQINDCWPTMSWSSVDYFGRWKALHYMVKKAFQPLYPIISRSKGTIEVSVASDKLADEHVTLVATLYNFAGKSLWKKETDTLITANSSRIYLSIPEKVLLSKGNVRQCVFEIQLKNGSDVLAENLFYFKDCKELVLLKPEIKKVIKKVGEKEYQIELTTNTLAKNVALFTAETEGHFSDNYFDMIPGKTYTINLKGTAKNLEQELQIMCVNEAK